jgi:hypothetical protein
MLCTAYGQNNGNMMPSETWHNVYHQSLLFWLVSWQPLWCRTMHRSPSEQILRFNNLLLSWLYEEEQLLLKTESRPFECWASSLQIWTFEVKFGIQQMEGRGRESREPSWGDESIGGFCMQLGASLDASTWIFRYSEIWSHVRKCTKEFALDIHKLKYIHHSNHISHHWQLSGFADLAVVGVLIAQSVAGKCWVTSSHSWSTNLQNFYLN